MKTPPNPTPPPPLAPAKLAKLVTLSEGPVLRYHITHAIAQGLRREGLIELVNLRITERGTAQRKEHWRITDKGRRTVIVSNARAAADALHALARQGIAGARDLAARALRRLPAAPPIPYPIPAGIRPSDLDGLVAVVVAGALDSARAVTFAAELRAWADAIETQ